MSGLNSVLGIATNALRAHQQGLQIASHNLANAGTEGYSRQRPIIAAAAVTYTAEGAFGGGASTVDVVRVRDTLLDRSAREQFALHSRHEARESGLSRLESVFGEPAERGVAGAIDRFFSAWSDLATDPGNGVGRALVRQRSDELAGTLRGLARDIDGLRGDVEARLATSVSRVNELTASIADLNRQIVKAEVGGTEAPDLRDLRDRAIDELSGLVAVQAHETSVGSLTVSLSGITVVHGADHVSLSVQSQAGTLGIAIPAVPGLVTEPGGEIQGMIENLNLDLTHARAELDRLTEALVTEVNARHVTGTTVDGATGVFLFDPAGLSANTIALSSDVAADARAVAAGTPDGSGGYRAGANDVALAVAGLREAESAPLGTTYGNHVSGLVAEVGQEIRSARDRAEVHATLAEQANAARQSVSGVSTDEELVQVIRLQTAYQAAARIVTATDQMLDALIAM